MFTVSQYDSYSYLFYQPTFISLDPTVTSSNLPSIPVQGIRIGLNGTVPQVGQAYIPLNTTVTPANYTPQGEVLSPIGTVIGLQAGPLTDQFFLTFDVLGSQDRRGGRADPDRAGAGPGSGGRRYRRAHLCADQLDAVGAHRRADDRHRMSRRPTQAVQQQLPPTPTLESFSSANQVGIAQFAIQYCNEMVNNPTLPVGRYCPA